MQKHYFLAGLMFLAQFLPAQAPKWLNYANEGNIGGILPLEKEVWISTQGGLERIDRETGTRKIYQPWNSKLRGIDIESAKQAPDGKLWVAGNNGGLYRFDGNENWEQFYAINTGDTLIQIKEMELASGGGLWFISHVNNNCSGCSKLFYYDGNQFAEHLQPNSSPLGNYEVRFIALDNSGILWASGGYKIVRYDGNTATDAGIPLENHENILNMIVDRNNTLWVSTTQYNSGSPDIHRLRYFDGSQWQVLSENSFGGKILPVNKIFKDPAGNIFLSFTTLSNPIANFAKYDGNNWQYFKTTTLPNLPSVLGLILLAVDQQGHFWFSSYGNETAFGVYEFDGQNWTAHRTEIFGLANTYVYDVAFDCENNAWFAGHGMLSRFDGLSWKSYTLQDMGINADYFSIWSLTVDTLTCDLWISFYDNNDEPTGFAKFDGATFTKYSTPDEYDVFQIAVQKDSTVWVASANAGLGKFDGSTWIWFNEQNSEVPDYLQAVTVDPAQNVWIVCGYPYAIMRWNGSYWIRFDQTNSPVSSYANFVYIDHEGSLWTGAENGLLRFKNSQWQFFNVPGTNLKGIDALTQDKQNHYWISNRAGVHEWDGTTFKSYNFVDNPMASNYTWRLKVDRFNNKWLIHNSNSGVTLFNEKGISNQVFNPVAGVYGKVYFDANQNGQQEPGASEPGIPNEKVWLQPKSTAIFTNFDGSFSLFPSPGKYELNYPGSVFYTPTTAQNLPLNMGSQSLGGYNYGAWAENPEDSIAVDMTLGPMRCSSEMNVWLKVTNYGILDATGDLILKYDPALEFLHATPEPDVIQDNVLTWHYSNLSLYEIYAVNAVFKVPDANAVGQILSLQADANLIENGIITANAEDDQRAEVRCSFDPNDKAMASTGASVGNYSLLDDPLDYTIRFQNSGNDTAFVVVIRDTLDPKLDWTSLEIVSSSHTMRSSLTEEGVLTFIFERINLLWEKIDYVGSQGFVKYRIAPKEHLPDPSLVRNTAYIYFDFNPAIVTNTTTSILVETLPVVGTHSPQVAQYENAKVYPNPNTGDFRIEWPGQDFKGSWQLRIVDLAGRLHFQSDFDQKSVQIRNLSPGIFFLWLEKDGQRECRKLIVSKS